MSRGLIPIFLALPLGLVACATTESGAAQPTSPRTQTQGETYGAFPTTTPSYYPLVWKPVGKTLRLKQLDRTRLYGERIKVVLFDMRPEPRSLFGENVKTGRQFHTRDDVPAWLAQHLMEALAGYSVSFVPEGETLVLKLAVDKAKVVEAGKFNAEILVRVATERPDGTVLWTSTLTSRASRFGRTHNIENYYDALSRSVYDLARDLMNSDGFIYTLGSGAGGYPAPVPPPVPGYPAAPPQPASAPAPSSPGN